MYLKILICILAVCLIAMVVTIIMNVKEARKKKNKYNSMSLKESMDLCDMPVVTFMNNGNKFNFLFDTGSIDNHVSVKTMDIIKGTESNKQLNVQGFNGNETSCGSKIVDLVYKDVVFSAEIFASSALDNTFAEIKKNLGVQIHGVLGSSFLKKYGYVLDFYDLIVYAKK